ncbi:MAG: penicillin-binding transpeptidase domain-containing protein, partial [Lentisphaeria bacterium]
MKRHYKCRTSCTYLIVSTVWIGLLVWQLHRLQVDRHEELVKAAKAITAVQVTEVGRRGRIYDFYGNLLVGDSAVYDVSIYSEKYKKYNIDKMVQDFNRVFGTSIEILLNRFENAAKRTRSSQVQVARDIDIDIHDKVRNNFKGYSSEYENLHYPDLFSRLEFTKKYRRFYPTDKLLTHVIGYLGETKNSNGIMSGQVGIEKSWNEELRPKKSGKQSFIRAQNGSMFEADELEKTYPEHGSDIYLTIHQPIQSFIEHELEELVKEFSPKTAYIAMANPKTGAILGMAQYPSFDLNNRASVKQEQLKNRMLLDYFEPGSTMKGVSIAGALDAGVVDLNSMEY